MNSIYDQMNKIDDKESLNEKYNVRTPKDVKKLAEATKPTKVERPKGFKGSVGGYIAVDRYGIWVSSKPNSGGVKISDANYDWIKENFKLTTLPEEEYKTIWGRGTVYKIEKKDTVNESLKKDVKKLQESVDSNIITESTNVERPKGFKGTAGGFISIDRYGTFYSAKKSGGGVKISDANYEWIRDNFELVTDREYETLWGKGKVYKLEKKAAQN